MWVVQCGSCWAFSGVAMLESAFMIQKGLPAMDLAEQDLVDCAPRSHSGKGKVPSSCNACQHQKLSRLQRHECQYKQAT